MIVAFAGQKGGVGKTTCAVSTAVEWHARGRRVLLVDTDEIQGSARTWGMIAAEAGVAGPVVVSMGVGLDRDDQLPALARGFDVTVVDCPGRIDEVQRSVLLVADLAIFPCGPGPFDGWALGAAGRMVASARVIHAELVARSLVTRRQRGTLMGREIRNTLAGSPLPALDTELSFSVVYPEAANAGRGPTTFRPKSETAQEIRRLCTELERLVTGDVDHEEHRGA